MVDKGGGSLAVSDDSQEGSSSVVDIREGSTSALSVDNQEGSTSALSVVNNQGSSPALSEVNNQGSSAELSVDNKESSTSLLADNKESSPSLSVFDCKGGSSAEILEVDNKDSSPGFSGSGTEEESTLSVADNQSSPELPEVYNPEEATELPVMNSKEESSPALTSKIEEVHHTDLSAKESADLRVADSGEESYSASTIVGGEDGSSPNLTDVDHERRVLKPPGGGSSDIFGAPEPVQNSPRRVQRPQMQSSLFGPPEDATDTPVRSKPGNDSYNRLFGPVDPRPPSASKNRLKSNIMLNSEEPSITPAESKSSDSNSSTKSETDSQATPRRNPVTGDGMYCRDSFVRRSARKRDGNPVTGEGYAAVNGDKESSAPASNNSAPVTNGSTHSAPPQRNRVPPGGYSSGLW